MKRFGAAGDVAAVAAFLLDESSAWITGQVIPVDGGMSALRTFR
jgi:NAD(P)-dependent dehydrogenase (short-subunit alcohol dehydrogenase family)